MTTPTQPDTNGLAVASLVLGVISITGAGPLTGVPAVITGFLGLKNPINRSYSIAGIIMGGISIVLTILVILFFLALFAFGAFFSAASQAPAGAPNLDSPDSSGTMRQRA